MNIIRFPGSRAEHNSVSDLNTPPQEDRFRHRDDIKRDVDRHISARRAYAKAVAWEIAVQDQDLAASQIEAAREATAEAYRELSWAGHALVVNTPADPRALVDLLMYMEKNFSTLPQEVMGRSLALDLLHTMRLSLRRILKEGKAGPS